MINLTAVAAVAGVPDEQLNPKKKIFEAVQVCSGGMAVRFGANKSITTVVGSPWSCARQPDFLTNDECVAMYKGVPWSIKVRERLPLSGARATPAIHLRMRWQGKAGVLKAQTMAKAPIK